MVLLGLVILAALFVEFAGGTSKTGRTVSASGSTSHPEDSAAGPLPTADPKTPGQIPSASGAQSPQPPVSLVSNSSKATAASVASGQPSSSTINDSPTPLPVSGLVIEDGGSAKSFQLALDEIWVSDADGKGRIAPVQANDAAELEALVLAEKEHASAVLYVEGEPRSELSRRLVTNEVTAKLAAGTDIPAVAASVGAGSFQRPEYAPEYVVFKTAPGLASLRVSRAMKNLEGVETADAQLARLQTKRTLPNDTLVGKQWHLKFNNQSGAVAGTDIDVESVWNYPAGPGIRGTGIRIGIVDDGLQTSHPDLAANVDTVNDKDWNGNDADPSPGTGDDHGTACAGNAAARGNNGVGVCGSAPEATLVGMRLISAAASDSQEAEAMAYLPSLIQIKSNSWGPNDDGVTLEGPGPLALAALKTATETGRNGKGTIFMWAAGNGGDVQDNSNYDGYANSIYTNAVAAFDSLSRQAYYSEPGANVLISAPSSGDTPSLGITTVDRSGASGYNTGSTSGELSDANYTQTFGGTSSATPTAAGVVALILQANPNLGWRDVQEVLITSARKVNPTDADWKTNGGGFHFNHKFGAGLIDAASAVALAKTFTGLGAMKSTSSASTTQTAIPDNSATGVTRTFNFTSSPVSRVEHVTVKLTVTNVPKGQLEVTLTSPSGTISRLCETGADTTNKLTNWTFMTVRNWGENPTGTWTLKVADRKAGTTGSLTSAELTLFGSSGVTVNPPPVVSLTTPTEGQTFPPNTVVTLTATATDQNAQGNAGLISQVQFFSGATSLGIDTTAPYSLAWTTPTAVGNYTLTARATDTEGAAATSTPVNVTVANPAVQLLTENFATLTGGSMTSTTSNVPWSGNLNFPTIVNAYRANGAVRIGTSVSAGSLTSKPLDLSKNGGRFSVKFDVKGWVTVEGNIIVSVSGSNFKTVTYAAPITGSFESKVLNFTGGTSNMTVTIKTSTKRAFLDNVSITSGP